MVVSKHPVYRSHLQITNIYHLFTVYRITSVLVEQRCKKMVEKILARSQELVKDLPAVKVDTIKRKDVVDSDDIHQFLEEQLSPSYDLVFVTEGSFTDFVNVYHKATWIFCFYEEIKGDKKIDMTTKTYIPYNRVNDCFDGVLYLNEFKSIMFDHIELDFHTQTYIRDKPIRFLKKACALFRWMDMKTVVEIGSCRQRLRHPINELNPLCCNDGHSTMFWAALPDAQVHTVDINPACEHVISRATDDGYLKNQSDLDIYTMDGLEFLTKYQITPKAKKPTVSELNSEDETSDEEDTKKKDDEDIKTPIDLLFLDAWDVVPRDESYAKNHLKAYRLAKDKLSKTCIISIDDTDIGNGGKGRLLIPKLLKDGFIMLYKGRHTIFYRGSLDLLFG